MSPAALLDDGSFAVRDRSRVYTATASKGSGSYSRSFSGPTAPAEVSAFVRECQGRGMTVGVRVSP